MDVLNGIKLIIKKLGTPNAWLTGILSQLDIVLNKNASSQNVVAEHA